MKTNALLVINPTAGSINCNEIETRTRESAEIYNFNLKIFQTSGKDDKIKIERLLDTINFERLLVAGGDGTVNMVASILINRDVVMGILACGSANGLATSMGIPKNLDEQLKIALNNKSFTIDTLLVNEKLCVHIADIGINAELIYNYEKANASGMLGYAFQSIPTLFKSNYPYKFWITINDSVESFRGVLLAFANATKYGTGANINPEGQLDDGFFEVTLYKRLSVWAILKTFFKKTKDKSNSTKIFSAKNVSVRCENPIALQIDGEYIGEYTRFTAKIQSKSLKLAVPNSF
ncbi:diacylglycerol/lipid kinase family protein [Winogradskyella ursingii]|uniref:diacylglycerol/lipid kinase family protein n=1 Tax=Winogradskyella ursingii TaxID=2686079 RepID=UPI0015CAC7DA|nr:diacylglycerol kinase family protein [Winogradskyella ursingii]